jgi:hypothetical protein
MNQVEPKNANRIIRDVFFDLTLSLERFFSCMGVRGILAEDIIVCWKKNTTKRSRAKRGKKTERGSWKPVADKIHFTPGEGNHLIGGCPGTNFLFERRKRLCKHRKS